MSETRVDHLVDGANPSGSTNYPLVFEKLAAGLGLSLVNQHTVRKHYRLHVTRFNKLLVVMNKLLSNNIVGVTKVYRFQTLEINKEYNSVSYFYDMQRLYPLTKEEYSIVNCCSDNLNTKWEDNVPLLKLAKKQHPKLINFFNYAERELKYKDLHAGNVMKDKFGNYRLIDLEGFI